MMRYMKLYVAARFNGSENNSDIERLCAAVRSAGMEDYCFVRDVEKIDDQKELFAKAYQEIAACDAFLIDVSDSPSGGRVVEAGIAYALKKPVFVIVKNGIEYKELYDGISTAVIHYDQYDDISESLAEYVPKS